MLLLKLQTIDASNRIINYIKHWIFCISLIYIIFFYKKRQIKKNKNVWNTEYYKIKRKHKQKNEQTPKQPNQAYQPTDTKEKKKNK